MTRDEVLDRLSSRRTVFDAKVAAVPRDAVEGAPPGSAHSVKDIVFHVTAYERLIVERLQAAREGKTTAFDRDRVSWEFFNAQTWTEAHHAPLDRVVDESKEVFARLISEVSELTDDELNGEVGIVCAIDPTWLEGRPLWQLIALDAYDHYPMHYATLESAVRART